MEAEEKSAKTQEVDAVQRVVQRAARHPNTSFNTYSEGTGDYIGRRIETGRQTAVGNGKRMYCM